MHTWLASILFNAHIICKLIESYSPLQVKVEVEVEVKVEVEAEQQQEGG